MERTLREDKLVGAAGLRDARRSEPLTSASKVQIGWVVKTQIATGVLRLVTEGRLSLDTTLASLLPGVALDNPPSAATVPSAGPHVGIGGTWTGFAATDCSVQDGSTFASGNYIIAGIVRSGDNNRAQVYDGSSQADIELGQLTPPAPRATGTPDP